MTTGDVVAYTKTFDVSLSNTFDTAIDLATTCLVAQTADNERFGLDTVDKTLTTGSPGAGENVAGFATFRSDTDIQIPVMSAKIRQKSRFPR